MQLSFVFYKLQMENRIIRKVKTDSVTKSMYYVLPPHKT